MQIHVNWTEEVAARFPELAICVGTIDNVRIVKENESIKKLRRTVYEEAKAEHNVETLKDDPLVRAYRDFYWKLGIDPTKTRPSGEALLRRVLNGNELPDISTVVDAYNLASMETVIPISGFDQDKLDTPFEVRFARNSEPFIGIGMDKPILLTDKMPVLTDKHQVLCIYPYRDSDLTKITMQTRNVVIVGYGAPGLAESQLKEAAETTLSYIKQVSSGEIETIKVFSSRPK
jgi:DNA/RNA-binding domain of Phe-tRNA-synthetase-like protein